ncbi:MULTISPECIES: flagellar basal body-associated FliL family protein [Sulfurospirillum]|jgi:flagellar FliL protein|uniref:flagellar basal body-associated FliL family protein n=1 Tax=Sulfurospirillum TaxID=57665 RepID=UPI0005437223|nr:MULTISPECIES: flagellar basal body-associated FliL family protein [Sulfurospirillum]KHG34615.1 MAG: flagellar basal body protein FliL [Sulfurospirillum sp. MES]MCD8544925.1 flagellar basal body-associated FliL family protein [Sulfurospirillum cavolei]
MLNEKLLKITLGFIILLIGIGFWTIRYMLKEDSSVSSYENVASTTKATNVSTDANEVNLDTIYINIRSQKFKIMKADIALIMKNANGKKALKGNMENVRNAVLQYLNTMDSNGLDTLEGKERLKSELIGMLEENFGYEVETIYLKNFILSP